MWPRSLGLLLAAVLIVALLPFRADKDFVLGYKSRSVPDIAVSRLQGYLARTTVESTSVIHPELVKYSNVQELMVSGVLCSRGGGFRLGLVLTVTPLHNIVKVVSQSVRKGGLIAP